MNGSNPMDEQILGTVANEVNGFLNTLNQTKVGFMALFQQQFQKLAQDYITRGKQIALQQEEIEKLTKEIIALKGN